MSLKGNSVEVEGESVIVGEEIGDGAEGKVYAIQSDNSAVLKVFDEDVRSKKAPKIRAMLKDSNRPNDPTKGFHSIVWPQSEVTKSGEFLGYKMPYLDQNEWSKALVYQMKELTNNSLKERLRPSYNLAFMLHEIHKQGHALGDFNHENIFVKDGYISLIDCDGFHINADDTIYGGETFLPRYSPPEKRPDDLDGVREADKFCLGVHIFQFLMEGYHPYQAKGSEAAGGDFREQIEENHFPYSGSTPGYEPPEKGLQQQYDDLPKEIRELFEDCFSQSSTALGWARPSATKWAKTLGRTDVLDIPEEKLPDKGSSVKKRDEGGNKGDLSEKAEGIFGNANEKTTDSTNGAGQTTKKDDDTKDLTKKAEGIFGDAKDKSTDSTDKTTEEDGDKKDLSEKAEGIFGDNKKSSNNSN